MSLRCRVELPFFSSSVSIQIYLGDAGRESWEPAFTTEGGRERGGGGGL